jgi:hypothetical protein
LTFNGLHNIISQKIELFITTPVRTSNPAIRRGAPNISYASKITVEIAALPSVTSI